MATHDHMFSGAAPSRTPIVARRVEDSQRLMALPRYFGQHMMIFEGTVYTFMRRFAPDYRGGWWEFHELSNGGFYMALI